jgi:hypothetical protein
MSAKISITPRGGEQDMCFHRSRRWEERATEAEGRRLWDLFYRETERDEPPAPIAQREDEESTEPEREETRVGAER